MASHDYHFVSHWRVKGKKTTVFKILKDGKQYSQWWKPAYLSSEEISPAKIESLIRAKLPYTLRFVSEIIREDPPDEFEISATGELAGTGRWKLQQNGDFTEIDFYWNVSAEKPIIRWLSFLLKPLFAWNHDWVMNVGEKSLQKEVERVQK